MEEQSPGCYCRVVPLRKVLPSKYFPIIETSIQNTSEIVREAYQFWKAFCLFRVENGEDIITFDREVAKLVFKVIAFRKGMARDKWIDDMKHDEYERLENSREVEDIIKYFYITRYKPVQKTKFPNAGSDILDGEIIQMRTAINTHIKVHFYSYVKRLVFSIIPKKTTNARNRRSILLKDLFENTFKSGEEYHEWIKYFGEEIKNGKKNLYSNPQSCLPLLYRINKVLEEFEEKTFSWLPLRKSIIPASFTLSKTICKQLEGDNMWDEILDLIKKLNIEPKQETRISSIRTAGSSASIVFTPIKKIKKKAREEIVEKYIDDLNEEEILGLQTKTIVAADPNKGNILQMLNGDGIRFRYTAQQRKFETHSARYRSICLKREKAYVFSPENETPIRLTEALLQMKNFNSRTTNFEDFMMYIEQKNLFTEQFRNFYFQMWHRKFKFNVYMNNNRSKDRFLNNFQSLYGSPQTTILCVGDWEQKPGISFGKAPTIGIGIRNWFRKRGYSVYLVDECRTSLTCSKCKQENEYNWQRRKDPRPWRNGEIQRVWGLSRCQNSQCRAVHNRDVNSSENINFGMRMGGCWAWHFSEKESLRGKISAGLIMDILPIDHSIKMAQKLENIQSGV